MAGRLEAGNAARRADAFENGAKTTAAAVVSEGVSGAAHRSGAGRLTTGCKAALSKWTDPSRRATANPVGCKAASAVVGDGCGAVAVSKAATRDTDNEKTTIDPSSWATARRGPAIITACEAEMGERSNAGATPALDGARLLVTFNGTVVGRGEPTG